jgi:hypothetical protein
LLNIDKSNFVLFYPPQKTPDISISLKINDQVKRKKSIKYLGFFIDCHLNWKDHIHKLSKKIYRGIGVLLKLCNFVSTHILLQVYYSIIYSFLTYGILIWGNTYKTNLHPLMVLQRKAICIRGGKSIGTLGVSQKIFQKIFQHFEITLFTQLTSYHYSTLFTLHSVHTNISSLLNI